MHPRMHGVRQQGPRRPTVPQQEGRLNGSAAGVVPGHARAASLGARASLSPRHLPANALAPSPTGHSSNSPLHRSLRRRRPPEQSLPRPRLPRHPHRSHHQSPGHQSPPARPLHDNWAASAHRSAAKTAPSMGPLGSPLRYLQPRARNSPPERPAPSPQPRAHSRLPRPHMD